MRESWRGRAGRTTNSRIGWMLNGMGGLDGAQGVGSLDNSVFDWVEFSSPEKLDKQRIGTGMIRPNKANALSPNDVTRRRSSPPAGFYFRFGALHACYRSSQRRFGLPDETGATPYRELPPPIVSTFTAKSLEDYAA